MPIHAVLADSSIQKTINVRKRKQQQLILHLNAINGGISHNEKTKMALDKRKVMVL